MQRARRVLAPARGWSSRGSFSHLILLFAPAARDSGVRSCLVTDREQPLVHHGVLARLVTLAQSPSPTLRTNAIWALTVRLGVCVVIRLLLLFGTQWFTIRLALTLSFTMDGSRALSRSRWIELHLSAADRRDGARTDPRGWRPGRSHAAVRPCFATADTECFVERSNCGGRAYFVLSTEQ